MEPAQPESGVENDGRDDGRDDGNDDGGVHPRAGVWPIDSARDLAVAVRSGRRRLGLSQRALAARSGITQPTVARLEAERDVSFHVALAILRAVGSQLAALGPPIQGLPEDSARDTGGRRLPAHLQVRRVGQMPLRTHLRRLHWGGPLGRSGEYWTFERPYPWPDDDVRTPR